MHSWPFYFMGNQLPTQCDMISMQLRLLLLGDADEVKNRVNELWFLSLARQLSLTQAMNKAL